MSRTLRDKTNILGWTGGVGMGKSTSAELLRRRNIPVIDTDVIAHKLVECGQPALVEIEAVFGKEIISGVGELNRERLAEIVFADVAARQKLEAILHPRIRSIWRRKVEEWRGASVPVAAVIIPLLFETGTQMDFDAIACVACAGETQMERLLFRGWTRETSERRNRSQWPIETKIAQSDFVIWTEGSVENHDEQINEILSKF